MVIFSLVTHIKSVLYPTIVPNADRKRGYDNLVFARINGKGPQRQWPTWLQNLSKCVFSTLSRGSGVPRAVTADARMGLLDPQGARHDA